jgi:probable HAF family extracellular repeat protein
MTNIEFHGSSRRKMLFFSQLFFKRFFGKRSAVFLGCLVFGVITQALLQSTEAQIKYTVTRLVPISGVSSYPVSLNAQGDVVGYYYWRDGTQHVFLSHAGVMHDIAALAGSFPADINIYGRIVGNSLPNLGPYTYFEKKVWSISHAIPGLKPVAVAVNTASHILCSSNLGTLIWQKSGITFLPTPSIFYPAAINNSDQVVGIGRQNLQEDDHAFLISGGQAIDLGTVQNLPGSLSFANAVNDQGQIAGGWEFLPAGAQRNVQHAMIYSGGKMQDIQTIAPNDISVSSNAFSINNSGQAVGQFINENLVYMAFVYDGSQMIDLDTLIDPAAGWVLRSGYAINDAGQILAIGVFQNEGYEEACLLTPVR